MTEQQWRLSRRTFLTGSAAAGLLAIPVLSSCATAGGGDSNAGSAMGKVTKDNPLGMVTDQPVEVIIFDGGYGSDYATKGHGPMFGAKHPQSKANITTTKEINKTLQPRFAGGNPPEVIDNDGADKMDDGALASEGQLADLQPLLDAPSLDEPNKKVGDTLLPIAKEFGTYDGKFLEVPYTLTVFGIWYSQSLFQQRGWQTPKTWDEFTKLCDTIKAAGMAPYTFAGKYPQYQSDPLLTMAIKTGGLEVMKNIDNLEDGAWKVDAIKQSAMAWQEIGAKYLLQGTAGITHTESQTKQNNGQVAMLPCGSWLENEQKSSAPAGFDYGVFPVPSLSGSDKLPQNAVHVKPIGSFFVSAKSKNPRGGMEYLRTMLSKQGATKYAEMVASLSVVQDTTPANATPGLKASSAAFTAAGQNTFGWRFEDWYKELYDESKAAVGELMAGRATPDAFCDRMQRKADATKADPSVKKFKR